MSWRETNCFQVSRETAHFAFWLAFPGNCSISNSADFYYWQNCVQSAVENILTIFFYNKPVKQVFSHLIFFLLSSLSIIYSSPLMYQVTDAKNLKALSSPSGGSQCEIGYITWVCILVYGWFEERFSVHLFVCGFLIIPNWDLHVLLKVIPLYVLYITTPLPCFRLL